MLNYPILLLIDLFLSHNEQEIVRNTVKYNIFVIRDKILGNTFTRLVIPLNGENRAKWSFFTTRKIAVPILL